MNIRPAKWKPSEVSAKRSISKGMWARMIGADLLRAMKMHPSQTFLLLDDNGNPLEMLDTDVSALRTNCPRPYRLQSRRVEGPEHKRLVWVSMDPGHWAHQDKLREKKNG